MRTTQMPAEAGANLPFIYMPIAAVRGAVGFSTSRIYELMRSGEFPAGDLIGKQSRRWKSTDIAAWLIEQSEKAALRDAELAAPLKRKADKAAEKSALVSRQRSALAAGGAPYQPPAREMKTPPGATAAKGADHAAA